MSAASGSARRCSSSSASASSTLATPASLAAASAAALAPLPATSTCTSEPIFSAADSALAVWSDRRRVVVLGDEENCHLSDPFRELRARRLRSSACRPVRRRVLTLTPALRPPGSSVLSTFRRGLTSAPKSAGRLLVERLLLGLHDVGQRGIARLVEAQVGGDDRRQLQFDRLQAAIDLARHLGLVAVDARSSRRRCPAPSRAGPPASGRSGWRRRRSPACRG